MAPSWPLTGRAEELAFIDAAMTREGAARGVVLAGAAGVGKTRLARHVFDLAGERGERIRWVAATQSARAQPLAPFAGLVSDLGDDPSQTLHRAAEQVLGDDQTPVVVGVDDAHLLDELSASLVHRAAVSPSATVVVTVRSGEPAPDAITRLWKDELLDRLEVQPLSPGETAELLETVLTGPVEQGCARRVWDLTRGNVLFLRHLVDGELEAGRLEAHDGLWCWSGSPELAAELIELVEARMGSLADRVADVVDLLAFGEPLTIPMLTTLTDAVAVEDAEEAGLVDVERADGTLQARLGHPLYGEARRSRIGELRARRIRGRIAAALADSANASPHDLLRQAMLVLESDVEADPALFTGASATAFRYGDLGLAESFARAAVAAGGGFDSRYWLGHVLSWLSHGEEADEQAAMLTELATTPDELTEATILRAGNLFFILHRPVDATAIADAALVTITDPRCRPRLLAPRAAFDFFLGRPEQAIVAAEEALESNLHVDVTLAMTTWALVGALGVVGRAAELSDAAARCYAQVASDVMLRVSLGELHQIGLHLAGHLKQAETVAVERQRETSTAIGVPHHNGTALLGYAALAAGRVRASERLLRGVIASLPAVEATGVRFRCLLSLTQALAIAGDREAARRSLADLEAVDHPQFVFLQPEVVLARAWVAAADGALGGAIRLANDAAAIATDQGASAYEVLALHTAVCFGDRVVADRLAALAELVDGPRAPASAAHAAALAAGDGDALLAASQQFEAFGDLRAAADAAAQAATTLWRRGLRQSANAAAARTQRLAEQCEGARTPAILTSATPLPLTSREREIVTLAARGLSNRDIAERLVVSVRTVEGHLYRASAKLGTTDRNQFADLLPG